jgi:hypothetical protein
MFGHFIPAESKTQRVPGDGVKDPDRSRGWRLALILIAIASFSQGAWSQTPRLKAGPLVYIVSQVPARVELDGQTIGEAPLLLNLSGLRQAQVLIISDTGEDSFALDIDPSVSAIAYYRPDFKPFTGMLSVRDAVPGSSLSVDGGAAVAIDPNPVRLTVGPHSFIIHAPLFASIRGEVIIENHKMHVFNAKQIPGHPLVLSPPPPEGTVVKLLDAKGLVAASFPYGGIFLFPAGEASFAIDAPTYPPGVALKADPSKGAVPSPLPSGTGTIILPRLPKGAKVLVDGKDAEIRGESVELARGVHTILIELPDHLPSMQFISVESGSTVRLSGTLGSSRMPLTPSTLKKRKALIATFMVSGIAVAAGGYILNTNEIAIALSPDYSTYSAIKYIGLGTLGVGAALFGVSFAFPLRP